MLKDTKHKKSATPKHANKEMAQTIEQCEFYHIIQNLSIMKGKLTMEQGKVTIEQATLTEFLKLANRCQAYRTGLEILMNMCKRDTFVRLEDVLSVCETVLKEGNEDVCV